MAEEKKRLSIKLVAINSNDQIKKLRTFGDRLADKVTDISGSTAFLLVNIVWFVVWITVNKGVFGDGLIFDEYPFGFLTMVVSLEAILLSVFVLISQNRSTKRSELRAELDYIADLQADVENITIINILEKIAEKNEIDISSLLKELEVEQKRILREHPINEE